MVVLQHPVTTEYNLINKNINETIKAIMMIKHQIIWLWPNVDAGSDIVSKKIRIIREKNQKISDGKKNYSPEDYLKLIYNSSCLIGNSSSAIREGAYLGIPAVNIGNRQNKREQGKNVINTKYNSTEIFKSILRQIHRKKYPQNKIFGDGKAGKNIRYIIKNKIRYYQKPKLLE